MPGMSPRARLLTCAAALAVVGTTAVLPATSATAATDYTEGLRVESSTTYTIDLAGSVIHVEEVIHLTNEVPDRVTQSYVEKYYFTDHMTFVLPGATNVAAAWDGGAALPVTVTPADGAIASVARIDLVPDLYHGGTKTLRLTYDLPSQPPRSGAVAQVNQAFASLPVFTTADPGLGSVTVSVPEGLDVEVANEDLTRSTADGRVLYTATGIEEPDSWTATLIVRDDDALVDRMVFFDDIGVEVQAWPGDTEWLDVTADLVERGLPALRSAIGRPWLVHGQLEVVETAAPYVYGYAGWYQHSESLIEIGDDLDPHVTLHELAHAWFNGEAFDSRWINEGLADEFAALAMAELGMDRPLPEGHDPASAGRIALNRWRSPKLSDDTARDQEAYGYGTSWWVVNQLVEEIGAEAMAEVVNAAIDGEHPYPAESDEFRVDGPADWRTFLDHLEGIGGCEAAEELFRSLVVDDADVPLLDARAEARAAYDDLVAGGDGWAPPLVLRDALGRWSFDEAAEMLPAVESAYDDYGEISRSLASVDEEPPDALRTQFEQAASLSALADGYDDAAAATDAFVAAVRAEAGANPLARVGLLLASVDDELDEARRQFAQGDWDEAEQAARAAADGVAGATLVGGLTLGGAVLLIGAAVALVLWRRRRVAGPATVLPGPGPFAPGTFAAGPLAPGTLAPGTFAPGTFAAPPPPPAVGAPLPPGIAPAPTPPGAPVPSPPPGPAAPPLPPGPAPATPPPRVVPPSPQTGAPVLPGGASAPPPPPPTADTGATEQR